MGTTLRSAPALIETGAPITRDEITAIVLLWLAVAAVVWWQLALARAVQSRLGSLQTLVLFFFVLPVLAIFAIYPFLPPDRDAAQIILILVAAGLWLGSDVIMGVAEGREQRRLGFGQKGPLPRIIRVRRGDWIVILVAATLVTTPRVVAAATLPRPCVDVEARLAARDPGTTDRPSRAWMPSSPPAGSHVTNEGPLTLDMLVESRVDGDAGREQLIKAGFEDSHHQRSLGPAGPSEVTAQRFATAEGALAFDAYAARFACAFASNTSKGPHDGVGLQIRYADESNPYGDQVSWVDGPTRLLVWVGGPTPFTDHDRLDGLVESVP